MVDSIFSDIPVQYESIAEATNAIEFNMASDMQTGSLLKTFSCFKASGRIWNWEQELAWLRRGSLRHERTKLITIMRIMHCFLTSPVELCRIRG
jgi:hypothetical protein